LTFFISLGSCIAVGGVDVDWYQELLWSVVPTEIWDAVEKDMKSYEHGGWWTYRGNITHCTRKYIDQTYVAQVEAFEPSDGPADLWAFLNGFAWIKHDHHSLIETLNNASLYLEVPQGGSRFGWRIPYRRHSLYDAW
jgi:hypothetical protein